MAEQKAYMCDICRKQKTDVNHWWLIEDTSDEFRIIPWDGNDNPHLYGHACGQECAVKLFSQWMQQINAAQAQQVTK